MRAANLLACGIGPPDTVVEGDLNGLRIDIPEVVRLGVLAEHLPELAELIDAAVDSDRDPASVAGAATRWRSQFDRVHYVLDG